METYFIRHTEVFSVSAETKRRLLQERRIAIYFEGLRSVDPRDYQTRPGKTAVRLFAALAKNGGFVCAEYAGKAESLIGRVPPGSDVEFIEGTWHSGESCLLKTIMVQDAKWLSREDYLLLGVSRPRQGTIARWHAARDGVAALVEGREQAFAWTSVPPERQEIACSELLRLSDVEQFGLPRLRCLLLPAGRTLRDIDIVGLAEDGKRIFAQVTFHPRACAACEWKLDKLRAYGASGSSHLILFCHCENVTQETAIHVFPVQKVFALLSKFDWGRALLKGEALLGANQPSTP